MFSATVQEEVEEDEEVVTVRYNRANTAAASKTLPLTAANLQQLSTSVVQKRQNRTTNAGDAWQDGVEDFGGKRTRK